MILSKSMSPFGRKKLINPLEQRELDLRKLRFLMLNLLDQYGVSIVSFEAWRAVDEWKRVNRVQS